ncbi:PIN-like domain-containing protein [Streptomyces afghaniensis]|uniref:PIN-like domain-containing protein n=1 Tax=Streptomyces afghaniensis TaxID=66865 RepID=UPI0037AA7031
MDRNLGKTVPARLRDLGWQLHLVADEFPDDGQQTPDEEWVEHALLRGWVPLCKDGRIRGRDREREPIERLAGVLFYLDNQSLRIDEMVQRIHHAQAQIYRAVTRGGPAIYTIKNDGINKTWPDA